MKQEILNLVDKIIGKKDIMRSPAWWVNRIFKKTLDYSEDYTDKVTKDVESRANAKIDALGESKEDKIMPLYVPEFMGDSYKSWMQDENKRLYDEIIAQRCYICKIMCVSTTSAGIYHIGSPFLFLGSVFISAAFPIEWSTSDDVLELYTRQFLLESDGSVVVQRNTNIPVLTRESIIDNLESERTTAALSANQGRVLKEMVDANSARICRLPSGLQNSDKDNLYSLTGEEIEALGKATEDTLFYIVLYDEDDYEFINLPLSAGSDGSALICTGSLVRTSTLDSGATRITMTVWEFRLILGVRGYMTKTEQVIYESAV